MRVLVVTTPVGSLGSGRGGGVEHTAGMIIAGLLGRGHRVTVLAAEGSRLPPAAAAAHLWMESGVDQPSWQHRPRDTAVEIPADALLPRLWQRALERQGEFDRILLDAPCTGLGALRRRPEARWRKQPHQLPELVALQTELLTRSLSLLKPGGVLAYVTCSPVESETSGVISGVLATVESVETIDTPAVLDRVARVVVPHTRRGTAVQLWTHLHGTDAMFIQLLRKSR
jgi:16S rRNA (cytosine967-C5)-methyltransferase